MTILEAIIQGVIQGATEFLPVSSSGHLSISQHIFGIELPGILFDIMLHLGTLLAVIFVYRKLVWKLIKEFFFLLGDLFRGRFKWKGMSHDRRLLLMLVIGLIPLFFLFCPIPGTDMKVKDFAEQISSDTDIVVEGVALLATSTLLFLGIAVSKGSSKASHMAGRKGHGEREDIRTPDAIWIGITQCIAAVFPGLSRSGSTLSAGLIRGLKQQTALDYSFVMGIPSIAAAALVSVKDIDSSSLSSVGGIAPLLAGVITATVVGFLAIKLLRWIVTTNKLHIFAFYTLIVGAVVVILGIVEHVMGVNLFTGLPM